MFKNKKWWILISLYSVVLVLILLSFLLQPRILEAPRGPNSPSPFDEPIRDPSLDQCAPPSPENPHDNGCSPGEICVLDESFGFLSYVCRDCDSGSQCNNECVGEFDDNDQHCGGCDNACGQGQNCMGGICRDCPVLEPGEDESCYILCGNIFIGYTCVNSCNDEENCGGCGNENTGSNMCELGFFCDNGLCCVSGLENCGGECTDVYSDNDNCGSCGNACENGQVCAIGHCVDSPDNPDNWQCIRECLEANPFQFTACWFHCWAAV